jgi:hypothetical protein
MNPNVTISPIKAGTIKKFTYETFGPTTTKPLSDTIPYAATQNLNQKVNAVLQKLGYPVGEKPMFYFMRNCINWRPFNFVQDSYLWVEHVYTQVFPFLRYMIEIEQRTNDTIGYSEDQSFIYLRRSIGLKYEYELDTRNENGIKKALEKAWKNKKINKFVVPIEIKEKGTGGIEQSTGEPEMWMIFYTQMKENEADKKYVKVIEIYSPYENYESEPYISIIQDIAQLFPGYILTPFQNSYSSTIQKEFNKFFPEIPKKGFLTVSSAFYMLWGMFLAYMRICKPLYNLNDLRILSTAFTELNPDTRVFYYTEFAAIVDAFSRYLAEQTFDQPEFKEAIWNKCGKTQEDLQQRMSERKELLTRTSVKVEDLTEFTQRLGTATRAFVSVEEKEEPIRERIRVTQGYVVPFVGKTEIEEEPVRERLRVTQVPRPVSESEKEEEKRPEPVRERVGVAQVPRPVSESEKEEEKRPEPVRERLRVTQVPRSVAESEKEEEKPARERVYIPSGKMEESKESVPVSRRVPSLYESVSIQDCRENELIIDGQCLDFVEMLYFFKVDPKINFINIGELYILFTDGDLNRIKIIINDLDKSKKLPDIEEYRERVIQKYFVYENSDDITNNLKDIINKQTPSHWLGLFGKYNTFEVFFKALKDSTTLKNAKPLEVVREIKNKEDREQVFQGFAKVFAENLWDLLEKTRSENEEKRREEEKTDRDFLDLFQQRQEEEKRRKEEEKRREEERKKILKEEEKRREEEEEKVQKEFELFAQREAIKRKRPTTGKIKSIEEISKDLEKEQQEKEKIKQLTDEIRDLEKEILKAEKEQRKQLEAEKKRLEQEQIKEEVLKNTTKELKEHMKSGQTRVEKNVKNFLKSLEEDEKKLESESTQVFLKGLEQLKQKTVEEKMKIEKENAEIDEFLLEVIPKSLQEEEKEFLDIALRDDIQIFQENIRSGMNEIDEVIKEIDEAIKSTEEEYERKKIIALTLITNYIQEKEDILNIENITTDTVKKDQELENLLIFYINIINKIRIEIPVPSEEKIKNKIKLDPTHRISGIDLELKLAEITRLYHNRLKKILLNLIEIIAEDEKKITYESISNNLNEESKKFYTPILNYFIPLIDKLNKDSSQFKTLTKDLDNEDKNKIIDILEQLNKCNNNTACKDSEMCIDKECRNFIECLIYKRKIGSPFTLFMYSMYYRERDSFVVSLIDELPNITRTPTPDILLADIKKGENIFKDIPATLGDVINTIKNPQITVDMVVENLTEKLKFESDTDKKLLTDILVDFNIEKVVENRKNEIKSLMPVKDVGQIKAEEEEEKSYEPGRKKSIIGISPKGTTLIGQYIKEIGQLPVGIHLKSKTNER